MVFEWRENEGQVISLLCNSILLNFMKMLLNLSGSLHIGYSFSVYPW